MLKTKVKEELSIKNKGKIEDKDVLNVAKNLSYNGAIDVVVYDVRDKTPFVSYYIVASSKNEYRLKKLIQDAKESLVKNNFVIDHIEGKNKSTWILIDAKDIVIQLFTYDERLNVKFDDLYIECNHRLVEYKPTTKNDK